MRFWLLLISLNLLAVTAQAVTFEDRPSYTNGQYYVFSDGATATNALNALNTSGWFPLDGKKADTGAVTPGKGQTTKWADAVLTRLDGKFVFPRIPASILAHLKIPVAERSAWWDAFLPDVETVTNSWFPPEE